MMLQRPFSVHTHPMHRKTYIIPTPSIDALHEKIIDLIYHGTPGMIVYALTRIGKTYAIRYLEGMLKRTYLPGSLINLECHYTNSKASEGDFYSNFLHCMKHPDAEMGNRTQKRIRLINLLLRNLEKSKDSLLLLFVDEAQHLQVEEYRWLTEISNRIEKEGYRMTTFMFGQPQLKQQKDAFRLSAQTQIIGRFMVDEFAFHGIQSEEDLAACLQGYDNTMFPIGSDWSFTRFCLPSKWSCGFRSIDLTSSLWKAFLSARPDTHRRNAMEIPMKYFSQTIEILLLKDGIDDQGNEREVTLPRINDAIQRSGFLSAQEDIFVVGKY